MESQTSLTPAQLAYQKFLDSDFWRNISHECKKRDGFQCRKCRCKTTLQAHHIYYPEDWHQTQLHHLMTVCRRCHEHIHTLAPLKPSGWLEDLTRKVHKTVVKKNSPSRRKKLEIHQNRIRNAVAIIIKGGHPELISLEDLHDTIRNVRSLGISCPKRPKKARPFLTKLLQDASHNQNS